MTPAKSPVPRHSPVRTPVGPETPVKSPSQKSTANGSASSCLSPMLKDHLLSLGLDGSQDQIPDIKILLLGWRNSFKLYSWTGLDINY